MEILQIITPEQCKAGRCLLKWGQPELGKEAGISVNTIANFEIGKRNLNISTIRKIIQAFIDNGITFENTAKKITVSLETDNL